MKSLLTIPSFYQLSELLNYPFFKYYLIFVGVAVFLLIISLIKDNEKMTGLLITILIFSFMIIGIWFIANPGI